MRKLLLVMLIALTPEFARADFWGADLPLLAEIVFNTLHTMMELEQQTQHMNDELEGIKDKIDRIRTISELVKPDTWNQWKDPAEALRRLRTIYMTLPKEFTNPKSEELESEISKAMNLVSRVDSDAKTTFDSGKELERRGADASPGVAQKLTASGVGTLISVSTQTQVITSHITSLLAQSIAAANEREVRSVMSHSKSFATISRGLDSADARFSPKAMSVKVVP